MSDKRILFVTDAGSVSIGGTLYLPGMEIPIENFAGREDSLRELVSRGQLSQRRRRMRTDESGRVIKIDRSTGAAPLPSMLSQHEGNREVRPLSSQVKGSNEINSALAQLKRQQLDNEILKAREAKKVDEMAAKLEGEEDAEQKVIASEDVDVDADELAKIAEMAAPEDDGVYDDAGDELFEEDEDLVRELNEG